MSVWQWLALIGAMVIPLGLSLFLTYKLTLRRTCKKIAKEQEVQVNRSGETIDEIPSS